jgi:hypothetical protein
MVESREGWRCPEAPIQKRRKRKKAKTARHWERKGKKWRRECLKPRRKKKRAGRSAAGEETERQEISPGMFFHPKMFLFHGRHFRSSAESFR